MIDLNEYLAVEVMNYIIADKGCLSGQPDVYTDGFGSLCAVDKWNPRENIEQARQCADQFPYWLIQKEALGKYFAEVKHTLHDSELPAIGKAETAERALSLACARAKGWKDE